MFKPTQRRLNGLGWMVMHHFDNMFIAKENIGNIEVDKTLGRMGEPRFGIYL